MNIIASVSTIAGRRRKPAKVPLTAPIVAPWPHATNFYISWKISYLVPISVPRVQSNISNMRARVNNHFANTILC